MGPEHITQIMLRMYSPEGLGIRRGEFNDNAVADVIINELAENWSALPDSTKAVMLGIAYDLKVRHIQLRQMAVLEAAIAVRKAMQRSR